MHPSTSSATILLRGRQSDRVHDDRLRTTTDELFAAGATFTLLAWGFVYLYVLMQTLQPGCFAAVNPQEQRT